MKKWYLLDTQTALGCTLAIFATGFAVGYGVAVWVMSIRGLAS